MDLYKSYPMYLVLDILKYILDSIYIPMKYKISLSRINRSVFRFISEKYVNSLTIEELDIRFIQMVDQSHLKNQQCLLKTVKKLIIQPAFLERIGIDVVEELEKLSVNTHVLYMKYHHPSRRFPIRLSRLHQPNLRHLVLDYVIEIPSFSKDVTSETFPPIEYLEVSIHSATEITPLLNLLDILQPTLKKFKLTVNFREQVEQLKSYLINYKCDQMEVFNISNGHGQPGIYSNLILSQVHSLIWLPPIYTKSKLILNLLKENNVLTSLDIYIYDQQDLETLFYLSNQKPNLKQLNLTLMANFQVNDLQVFKYIECLTIDCHYEMLLNMLLAYTNPKLHKCPFRQLSICIGQQLIAPLIVFIESEQSLLLKYLDLSILDSNVLHYDKLSVALSKHPTLTSLSVYFSELIDNYSIFDNLGASTSLDYITIAYNHSVKSTYYFTQTHPKPPFMQVSQNHRTYLFIRNGIHYQSESILDSIVNKLKFF
ncbi:hypothetical protein DLAC_00838 [Tieghemostelium lacteum]|uniref:F-box domain-containing protein n=1 Tax=Tieghemostelium lacteum TaxID=361077 RepID=A0A152A7E3_TIELA|nr:hypothetical protein DLAC_00838 [Tieghemostelium lacteum]|eukprot:KYR02041.1 hypothetical protein DLAC_00838 [Tieghemostelium lacteum]